MSRCNGVAIVSQPSNSNCIRAAGRHVISCQIASVGARPVVRRTRPSGENKVTVASTKAASRSMTARRGSSSSSASIRWSWSEDSRCIARTSVLSSEALTALTTSRNGVRSGIVNTGRPRLRASSSSAGGTRLNTTSTPKPSAAAPISSSSATSCRCALARCRRRTPVVSMIQWRPSQSAGWSISMLCAPATRRWRASSPPATSSSPRSPSRSSPSVSPGSWFKPTASQHTCARRVRSAGPSGHWARSRSGRPLCASGGRRRRRAAPRAPARSRGSR